MHNEMPISPSDKATDQPNPAASKKTLKYRDGGFDKWAVRPMWVAQNQDGKNKIAVGEDAGAKTNFTEDISIWVSQ